jgi:hypothetical protein
MLYGCAAYMLTSTSCRNVRCQGRADGGRDGQERYQPLPQQLSRVADLAHPGAGTPSPEASTCSVAYLAATCVSLMPGRVLLLAYVLVLVVTPAGPPLPAALAARQGRLEDVQKVLASSLTEAGVCSGSAS